MGNKSLIIYFFFLGSLDILWLNSKERERKKNLNEKFYEYIILVRGLFFIGWI